jgi:hypothetical protein
MPPEPVVPPPTPAPARANPIDDVKPACRGAALSFDTQESEKECLIPNTGKDDLPASPSPSDLELTASIVEKSVRPGGTATIVVTTTNKTKEPMLLYPEHTCDDEQAFAIRVLDASKKRVEYLSHENCDTSTFGCTRRVLRIVLEPGGSMRRTYSFKTMVTKLAADCGEVTAGPMKPGTYALRVVTGFRSEPTGYLPRIRVETPLVVK